MSAVPEESTRQPGVSLPEVLLLVSVFVVAACGLVYELAAGALASYLLGDSVLQFSTIIGIYLFAMGVGSWLSRYVERQLIAQFLKIELLVGLIGGLMPAALFTAHSLLPPGQQFGFRVLLYALVLLVGTLVGLEIPLVMRILKKHFKERYGLKDLVSQVLTFDYLGALVVALAFPLLLVPHLGLVRTGLFFGLLNAFVAVWALWLFRGELRAWRGHALACALTIAALLTAFAGADRLSTWAEDRFYGEQIIVRETSDYQRVVVTTGNAGVRLFLNGNLQFHSKDEYRYHESLVHPAMAGHGAPKRVLVLGGGDGMAVREVLRYASVEQVTLVELDPHMTRLFATLPLLRQLNGDALLSPKLKIVNTDAFGWLEQSSETFDVIVIDFPDPSNFSLGKLYTTSFYQLVDQRLSAGGYAVVQTTSPLIARRSFWTVASTIEAVGLSATPYHAHVPSFGEWGFIIASRRPWAPPRELPAGLRFLNLPGLPALHELPARHGAAADRGEPPVEPDPRARVRDRMGQGPLIQRRELLLAGLLAGCEAAPAELPGGWVGASAARGHRLRQPLPRPGDGPLRRARVLIVGAGVSGLACARALVQAGLDDVALLELEDQPGGNSRGHVMGGMACPLGAHYLPLPGPAAPEVYQLLEELGLVRQVLGRTVYDERHLCHSPQERLFFEGQWHEGLLPPARAAGTREQYLGFARAVDAAQQQLGFAMPTERARWTAGHGALDGQTFGAWLDAQGLSDPQLRWYLDYCCRDDYGAGSAEVSAWAGLHYFASRHGFHPPGDETQEREAVLTWPQGNGWLTQQMAGALGGRIHGGRTVLQLRPGRHEVELLAWNEAAQAPERWVADQRGAGNAAVHRQPPGRSRGAAGRGGAGAIRPLAGDESAVVGPTAGTLRPARSLGQCGLRQPQRRRPGLCRCHAPEPAARSALGWRHRADGLLGPAPRAACGPAARALAGLGRPGHRRAGDRPPRSAPASAARRPDALGPCDEHPLARPARLGGTGCTARAATGPRAFRP